jgi:hypothetical protein
MAQDRQALQNRAWQAALAASTPPGEYEKGYEGQVFSDQENLERIWFGEQFGPGMENAQLNQLRTAQLLGAQRATGGAYTGRLGYAVRNAVQRMRDYYVATGNPRENFLRWYMERQGMGGAELPTAADAEQIAANTAATTATAQMGGSLTGALGTGQTGAYAGNPFEDPALAKYVSQEEMDAGHYSGAAVRFGIANSGKPNPFTDWLSKNPEA